MFDLMTGCEIVAVDEVGNHHERYFRVEADSPEATRLERLLPEAVGVRPGGVDDDQIRYFGPLTSG